MLIQPFDVGTGPPFVVYVLVCLAHLLVVYVYVYVYVYLYVYLYVLVYLLVY